MSDATDRDAAITAVIDRVQPGAVPTLTLIEVENEVDGSQIAKTWATSTLYPIGSLVVPAVRNGHFYESTQLGTSQSGSFAYSDWPTLFGAALFDGSSDPRLMWREAGEDLFNPGIFGQERNVYDIGWACRKCWLLKAQKAIQLVVAGDASFNLIYEYCKQQADRFYPFRRAVKVVRA